MGRRGWTMRVKTIKVTIMVILVLWISLMVQAQKNDQKVVQAVKADETIKIDGYLGERVWQNGGYNDFTQSEPMDGTSPSEETIVWVAFDQEGVYIAARLYDSHPDKIVGRLGRRDDILDSDWFIFSVDPYYDRRSGYQFAVNPRGSIIDWTIFNDEQTDATWDGVWHSAARVDDEGWTVEISIPYDQLRFKGGGGYAWGVNFCRFIKRKNEKIVFSWIPKEESGFVSNFAKLVGIEDIKPGRLVEIMPFSAGKADFSTQEEGNPFKTGKDLSANAGIDLKIGLRSNLTLDFTFNPDFGQVEVDPAVINLTALENYYEEKRPFFIEGARIFDFGKGGANSYWGVNWADPGFFYSRRIGRPPRDYILSSISGSINYPEWTNILAAARLTGKVGKDWNIGFLSALTEREYAEIDWEGKRSFEEIEPFSYYGVLRAQKEFKENRQGLGFIATSVLRRLRTDNLKNLLPDNAFGFAVDGWTFLDKDKTWVVTGWLGGTRLSGSKVAIFNLQNAFPHYFQRPDATHVELDENATSMSGWAGRATVNKQRGNLVFNAALGAVSPGFDSSDLGFLWSSDLINGHIMVGYRSFKPGKIFRTWNLNLFTQRNYDFGGNKIGEQRLIILGSAELLNYWGFFGQLSYNPRKWANDLTRGGPLTLMPLVLWGNFDLYSDSRKPIVLTLKGFFLEAKSGSRSFSGTVGLRWKPRSNFSISIEPTYSFDYTAAQWVTNIEDPLMTDTYGIRCVFAQIDQTILDCPIRINWIFTPRLSLQGYIQPFIAVGDYDRFKELARPKSFDFNYFGENFSSIFLENGCYTVDPDGTGAAPPFSFANPDFNYKSLRGTIVFRWEYSPGSTLYAVWAQNRADFGNPGEFSFGRDLRNLVRAPGDNIFMIKLTYRFKL